jgi:WD40 repeat protein
VLSSRFALIAASGLIAASVLVGFQTPKESLKDSDFVEVKKRDWPSQIESMEWSPDGKSFLTVFNGFTQHWGWHGAKRELRFVQAYANVLDQPFLVSRFSGDRYLVSASASYLQVTDLVKKEPIRQVPIPAGKKLLRAVVSPDGKTAVAALSGDRDELCLFDLLQEHAPRVTISDRKATNLTFSGDGKTFADVIQDAEKETIIEIWDTTKWEKPRRWTYPRPDDGVLGTRALALSPDGTTLVTGASDKTLRWWDTATGKETRSVGPGWVYFNRAAFRPDGKVLMTASFENHVRLWDVHSGKELPVTHGPGWTMAAVAWTPDGKRVLSVSEHSVYAHDAATGRELWRGGEHTDTAVQVVVTPDGKTAVSSGNDGRVIFREVESGKVVRTIENPRHSVDTLALSADGQTLTGLGTEPPHDGVLLRWDVQTGKAYERPSLPAKDSLYVANALLPTPDGSGVAVSSGTELRVPVFSPSGKELRAAYGPTDGGVRCAAYSPDGRSITAASLAGTIFIWETATGQERLVLKDAVQTTCLAFSPDGRIVAVANDDRVRTRTGDKAMEMAQDRTVVRLLDAYTGREFHRFTGHTGSVYRLAWSSDGRRLLSGSYDASCLIWDVTPAVRAKLPAKVLDERTTTKEAERLGSANATEAYAAMARLTGSPSTTIPAMRTILKPIVAANTNRVTALIRDLDSPQFSVREKAASQLLRMGDGLEGPLRTALAGTLSTEARERIEKTLSELKPSSDRLRQSRGLEVLQRICDAEAKKLLAEISNGADGAWLTREAKSALERSFPAK